MRDVALAVLGFLLIVVLGFYALIAFLVLLAIAFFVHCANGLKRLFAKKRMPIVTVTSTAARDPDLAAKIRRDVERSIRDGQDRRLREHWRRSGKPTERRKSDPLS